MQNIIYMVNNKNTVYSEERTYLNTLEDAFGQSLISDV